MSNQTKPQYTEQLFECPHCSNKSHMEVIAHAEKHGDEVVSYEYAIEYSRKWDIFLCPNCSKVIFHQNTYYSEWDEVEYDEDGQISVIPGILNEVLYPSSRNFWRTPENILELYRDAKRLTPIDPTAAVVKIRRLLDAVCTDQNAKGKKLINKLNDLVTRNIIPQSLYEIADRLREVGNLGAHEENITEEDAMLAQKLCETILEYVYEAPAMLADLGKRLDQLKG
ncbi:MAG: DUF4145 domain-containing protein [Anaerolineae bacterium]|nr:DUF4145 domain-containing protein [Anaerolineae bacterium]